MNRKNNGLQWKMKRARARGSSSVIYEQQNGKPAGKRGPVDPCPVVVDDVRTLLNRAGAGMLILQQAFKEDVRVTGGHCTISIMTKNCISRNVL